MFGIKFDKRKVSTLGIGFVAARSRMARTVWKSAKTRRGGNAKEFDAVDSNRHQH